MNNGDLQRLIHIRVHCEDIDDFCKRCGGTFEDFTNDRLFYKGVVASVEQIGELAGGLSDSFKAEHSDIPWQQMKGMRNWVIHAYGEVNQAMLWETVINDIPKLREFCENILSSLT